MLFLLFVFAAIALIMAISLTGKVARLRYELEYFRTQAEEDIGRLKKKVRDLERAAARPAETRPEPEPAAPPEAVPELTALPIAPPLALPIAEAPPIAAPPEPEPEPIPVTSEPLAPEPESEPEPGLSEPQAAFEANPAQPTTTRQPFDFESLIGVKLFSWIAGIALVLAAVFFLRYSIDHGWVTPPIRMAMGFAGGVGLLLFSSFRFGRAYPVTANALDGAGVAILYATTYASHALWSLIPFSASFVLMAIVTVVAVLLSIRRDSLFIALLGMLGGFATPTVLSSGENRPVALFSYLLILNAGLAWTAYRRRWPVLLGASVAFTVLYQIAWTGNFLDSAQLPLASGIFLAFPLLFTIFQLTRGRGEIDSPFFRNTTAFAGMIPLAFAVYTAAVPAIGSRFHVLFAFLLLAVAGFAFIAVRVARDTVTGGLPAIATLVVFAVWLARGWTPAAWPSILGWLALFVLLFAFGPLLLRRLGENAMIERSTLVAGALLFALPAIIVLEPATRAPALLFVVAALLLVAVAISAFRTGRQGDYMTAAVAILVAQGFWSARHLRPETLTAAVIMYGGFALLMLAIAAVGRAVKKTDAMPASPLLLFGTFGLAFFLLSPHVVTRAFPALAALTLLLFVAFAAESMRKGIAVLFAFGAGGTLALLFLWMVFAEGQSSVALLALVCAMALGALAIAALGRKRFGDDLSQIDFGDSGYLSLAAYVFLIFAAKGSPFIDLFGDASRAIAVPAGVLLPALAIVLFAIALAALHLRRPSLHLASILGSFVVLATWEVARWTAVSVAAPAWAAVAVAAFAIVWVAAAKRVLARDRADVSIGEPPLAAWTTTALVALLALQGITVFGEGAKLHIAAGAIAGILIAAPIALAILAAVARWHGVALLAVATSAITAVFFADFENPERTTLLAFAVSAAHYAIFTIYPFAVGRRAGRDSMPYFAAIAATVPFFFFARDAMNDWGWGGVIGILPVAIALVLLALLRRAIALETESAEENTGRRALVAGAALAFITAAIPLQLEKEWITIGWALEAAALAWLFGRIRHRGLLAWSAALFAVVFVRLVLNPAVLSYHPRSATAILNWYFYTYAVAAAAFFAGARLLRGLLDESRIEARLPKALASGGTLLLFLLLNIEIADFYSKGTSVTFDFFRASLAQELTYTLGWALFAIAMLVAGIVASSRSARIAAITLLSLTVFKCFIHDLGRLGGLYRVGSFIGLAISLAVVAVLLQKFALRGKGTAMPPTAGGAHP